MKMRYYKGKNNQTDKCKIDAGMIMQCRCDLTGLCRCIVVKEEDKGKEAEKVGDKQK